jgi:Flp pilus assembly protein TadD
MSKLVRALAAIVLLAGLGASIPAFEATAASSGSSSNKATAPGSDDSYARGERALKDGDWKLAIKYLERAAKLSPRDPDGFNLLAYSYRRLGKLDPAFANYEKALSLDPEHRGAHEYVGEAYLMVGELEKAEQHLSKLEEICDGSCTEAKKLENAIARFKENEKQATLDEDW